MKKNLIPDRLKNLNNLEKLQKLPKERTLTERVSYFLFVLMSVSGGVHDDFLKPFRKSPALRGVAFKCPM